MRHEDAGHEAVDTEVDIPSWSCDGVYRQASNSSRDWSGLAVRNQQARTNDTVNSDQSKNITCLRPKWRKK